MKTQGQKGRKDINSRRTEESNHDFHSPKTETSQPTPDQRFGCLVKRIPQLSFLHLTPEFSREYLWEEFPGGLVVKIWCFHFHSLGSILGPETEILQAAEHSQKKFKKRGCLRASVFQLIKWGLPMQFSLHHSPKCCQTQKERGRVDRKDAGTVK